MGVLSWEKPKQIRSKEEHADISFDGGPPGGYISNMSAADQYKWKAKFIGVKSGDHRVEIRKVMHGTNMLIVVTLKTDGIETTGETERYKQRWMIDAGCNIKISLNSNVQMSWLDFEDMQRAINEARQYLVQVSTEKAD